MVNPCQSEHAFQRYAFLQQSLLALLRAKTYHEISVKDICEHASIPRRTFYHYFTGKEDLMDTLISNLILECDLVCTPKSASGKQPLQQHLLQFFQHWSQTRSEALTLLLQNGQAQRLVHLAVEWVRQEARQERNVFPFKSENRDMTILAVISGIFALLFSWANNNFQESTAQMADSALSFLTVP